MANHKSTLETILQQCEGIRVERTKNDNRYYGGGTTYTYKFYKEGKVKVPDNLYIELIATAAKGTIARLADIEVETYAERYPDTDSFSKDNSIVTYGSKLIYECEGRKKLGRIADHHVKILTGVHKTEYVRNITKHEKVEVKNPVNKFKQEMQVGDWVIGVKPGKRLGIGRITRWTNHNVWAVAGEDINDKTKEFKFDTITETFTMPDDKHVPLITMAVLKGYRGG